MKHKKSIFQTLFIACLTLVLISSCKKDDTEIEYTNGVYISNEGSWGSSNASISFYSYSSDEVYNNIFQKKNSRPVGDVIQSITISADDKAFIAVNNSNKIEVANAITMAELGVIEEVSSPRYIALDNDKVYISCWGDNSVKVADAGTYTVSNTISVGSGPEKMQIINDKLYVANSGGWAVDSTISVIDLSSETVIANIPVKYSPIDIVSDNNGSIWVLCKGKEVYDPVSYDLIEETPCVLNKINLSNNTIVKEIELFEHQHPTCLEIDNNGETLFIGGGYGSDGIYKLATNETVAEKIIDELAYGFNIDPKTNEIFVTLAPDFTSAGSLKRYSISGELLGTYECGIGPNGAAFKKAE